MARLANSRGARGAATSVALLAALLGSQCSRSGFQAMRAGQHRQFEAGGDYTAGGDGDAPGDPAGDAAGDPCGDPAIIATGTVIFQDGVSPPCYAGTEDVILEIGSDVPWQPTANYKGLP